MIFAKFLINYFTLQTKSSFKCIIQQGQPVYDNRLQTLQNLDVFILDSSLRETNPGALEGYTLEKMRKVYEEIRKCDFKYFTLGSFTRQSQVEELFLNQLIADGDDLSRVFFFY